MMPKTSQPTEEDLRHVDMARDLVHSAVLYLTKVPHLRQDGSELDDLTQTLFETDIDLQMYLSRFTDYGPQ